MASVELDFSKLMGYRLVEAEMKANKAAGSSNQTALALSAKTGEKDGEKPVLIEGVSLGAKTGSKLGFKVEGPAIIKLGAKMSSKAGLKEL